MKSDDNPGGEGDSNETEPVRLRVDIPKPTSVVFRTCRGASYENISSAIESFASRYPQLPPAIFDGAKIAMLNTQEIDRKTLQPTNTDALQPASTDEVRMHCPNDGRNGVLIRHPVADSDGRIVHELLVYWSKNRAVLVREVVSDLEQL